MRQLFLPCETDTDMGIPSCQVPHEVSLHTRFSSSPGKREFEFWLFICLRFHGMLSSCRPWFYLKQVNDYRD